MATTPFAFTPTTGLRDSTAYPTNPGSEAAARVQVQTGMDQLRDYLNGQMQTDLAATYAKKIQEAWIAPTLLNSWVNFGGGYALAAYYKNDLGIVRIHALLKSGTTTAGTILFNLPAGYRPLEIEPKPTLSYNGTSIIPVNLEIQVNGNVNISAASPGNSWLIIDITFRAGQ